MSEHDEAMQAARRIEKRCQQLLLAKINPERDLVGFGDAMVVARALLSRERENEIIERCAAAVEAGIPRYMPGTWPAVALETAAERVRALKAAGEP
jgi:hypothetical protein